jgi:hypothetical protein
VVIVASVAVAAADFALDAVDAGRTKSRRAMLKKIDLEQRHRCVLRKLAQEAENVSMPIRTK